MLVGATLGLGIVPPLLVLIAYAQEKPNVKVSLGTPV
jgi:hypothetical protein